VRCVCVALRVHKVGLNSGRWPTFCVVRTGPQNTHPAAPRAVSTLQLHGHTL